MRFIFFLLITVILTACGHQKIRFSRVAKKQKVVEISEIPSLKKKSETVLIEHLSEEPAVALESTTNSSSTSEEDESIREELTQELRVQSLEETSKSFPNTVEDSTRVSREEANIITEEALQAEKDGTLSMIFGILFYAIGILGFIVLVIAAFGGGEPVFIIAAIAMGILSFVSVIASMILGVKSLRAAYNTPKGKRRAIVGVVLSGVAIGLFLINILLSI
ncbi:MAG: hypothetical protein AB8B56_22080 [Crocinitomicaceae bacterium]